MEIFLPWNWPARLFELMVMFWLVLLVIQYSMLVWPHIVTPKRRKKARERARTNAEGRLEYYERELDSDRPLSQTARRKALARYNKATADLVTLDTCGNFAFQLYQLKQVNWGLGIRHEVVLSISIGVTYVLGVVYAWQLQQQL